LNISYIFLTTPGSSLSIGNGAGSSSNKSDVLAEIAAEDQEKEEVQTAPGGVGSVHEHKPSSSSPSMSSEEWDLPDDDSVTGSSVTTLTYDDADATAV
jgi:hypothetical protein